MKLQSMFEFLPKATLTHAAAAVLLRVTAAGAVADAGRDVFGSMTNITL
jgi:hypothetical protein